MRLKVDDVVWREVDDELVVLELASTQYLTLNGSAKQLWLGLVDGSTRDGLATMLTDQYQISIEQSKSDVESFLTTLSERDLLDEQS